MHLNQGLFEARGSLLFMGWSCQTVSTSLVSFMIAQPQVVQCQDIFFLLSADDVKTRLMATEGTEIKILNGSLYFARYKPVSINFNIFYLCTVCY